MSEQTMRNETHFEKVLREDSENSIEMIDNAIRGLESKPFNPKRHTVISALKSYKKGLKKLLSEMESWHLNL